MKKYIITIIIIVGVLLAIFGSYYIYSNTSSKNSIENLKSKVDEEITYLNTSIISMMNNLNNITYANYKITEEEVSSVNEGEKDSSSSDQGGQQSNGGSKGETSSKSGSDTITNINMKYNSILVNDSKKIDWDNIKKETEKMYHTWPTVLIDLNALNVNRDNLLKYATTLDNITKAVEKEDKKQSLQGLADLYGLTAGYVKEYSNDSKKVSILDTKSNILYAYVLAEDENWQVMRTSLQKAQYSYNNIMNSKLQNSNTIANINQAYVLLNEIENSIDTKDKNIFYINYKNLMQELEILEA